MPRCPNCGSQSVETHKVPVEAETFLENFASEEYLREKRGNPKISCPRCGRRVPESHRCTACSMLWCGGCM